MARRPLTEFKLDARLPEQRECGLGVNVPIPLSERIEKLAELLYVEGHGTVTRKEIVASLLLAAPTNADELAALLRNYRRATVRRAHVGAAPQGNVVTFPNRQPGPRVRSLPGS